MRRARLELAVADLLIAARAFGTRSAGAHERNGHPVADLPPVNQHSECGDATGQFVPCDVRERDTGIMALPGVPIAAADTGSLHLDHHAVGSRLRIGGLPHLRPDPELAEDDRSHPGQGSDCEPTNSAEPATPAGMPCQPSPPKAHAQALVRWKLLRDHDTAEVIATIDDAFADNASLSACIDAGTTHNGNCVTLVVRYPGPEIAQGIVQAGTNTRPRSENEIMDLYRRAVASTVIATAKEASVAPPPLPKPTLSCCATTTSLQEAAFPARCDLRRRPRPQCARHRLEYPETH
jgi:hypothetical protein